MKCPHCGRPSTPVGRNRHIGGVDVIVLICPSCQAVLGAVNKK